MIDPGAPETLSSQLAAELKARIEAGKYPSRTAIPSIRHLCEEFHVSDGTVKKAVVELKNTGYLTTTPGRGTYVAPR